MRESTKSFFIELSRLLDKHSVSIEANDTWIGYPGCGQDIQISFNIDNDYEDLCLGTYIDSKCLNELII